ncbi:RyR domain-containing protein [Bradyrhizobium sp.]|uniref:RyR domain-containing protein n=1 Tax=Bradyrhizobium sp. TaxID=376 RepID=UPI0025B8CDAC|nr:RyR domain-containing protein [Bradyrhizobium sp.]
MNYFILRLTLLAGQVGAFVTRHRGWIQGVAGAIAMALGFWGWMIKKPPTDPAGWVDNFFRTMQLITLQFPTDFGGSIPLPLQIARLAVPLVAVLASFQALVSSITRPARLALLPHSSGHVIVCGSESLTDAALIALASRGRQVVMIAARIGAAQRDALEGLGLTIIEADPMRPATIRSLHLPYAAALFLTGDDDVDNLSIAMLALSAAGKRPADLPPLVLAVRIDRENFAVELDSALDGLSRGHGVRYYRLCPDREGIRLELTRFAPVLLKGDVDTASHVLVVGLSGNWRQAVAQVIAATQDHPDKRAVLTFIVDDNEAEVVKHWHEARPELDHLVEIAILPRQPDAVLPPDTIVAPWRQMHAPPHLAVILLDDADAIAASLALRRPGGMLGTDTVPVLAHQTREDRLLGRLGDAQVSNRDMTRLIAIGGLVRAESIERVLDRKGDEMAIALHAHYQDATKTLGWNSPAASQAWDELTENMRDANRAAAEHAPILFAAAGLRIADAGPGVEPVVLSDAELELLARVEHRRWIADRVERGWRYGAVRDDHLMRHPSLVPFDALNEDDKEKDRNAVRALLSVLAGQGRVVVRPR